jgi:hypothetical protein
MVEGTLELHAIKDAISLALANPVEPSRRLRPDKTPFMAFDTAPAT